MSSVIAFSCYRRVRRKLLAISCISWWIFPLVASTSAAQAASWLTSDDVLYCAMPLFHGNALNAIVFPALATGATIALKERFSESTRSPDRLQVAPRDRRACPTES